MFRTIKMNIIKDLNRKYKREIPYNTNILISYFLVLVTFEEYKLITKTYNKKDLTKIILLSILKMVIKIIIILFLVLAILCVIYFVSFELI